MMGKIKKEKISTPIPDGKSKNHRPKKKKSSDKKGPEDWSRKFGYILPQSIKSTAESIGISTLSDEVAKSLSEDVSYRLRCIVQLCSKYLKHSRHSRLTCQDVNEVLSMCDIPSLPGHSSPGAPQTFSPVREAGILVLDDSPIDLAAYALAEVTVPMKNPPTVTGKWLAPDGSRVRSRLDGVKSEPNEMGGLNLQNKQDTEGNTSENYKISDHLENEPQVATNLIKYYGITCNTVLGRSSLKVVLRDLSRNEKIVPILPFLLNFISISLNKLNSERQFLRLLLTVSALSDNPRVDITPYHPVRRVVSALLNIIKSTAAEKHHSNSLSSGKKSPSYYSHSLRRRAAQVLGKVMARWLPSEDQKTSLILEMGKILQDVKTPSIVHVGALSLLNELGPEALKTGLWGHLPHYLVFVRKLRQDRLILQEILLNSANIMYKHPHFPKPEEVIGNAPFMDRHFYELFGDSIICVRLQLSENARFRRLLIAPPSPLTIKIHDNILKRPWRLPKCINSRYNPEAKRPTIHTAFELPMATKKRNPRIIFKFAGAKPVPEISLRRRRLDSRYSQFIAGKESEGHVVLVGKFWKCTKPKIGYPPTSHASIFSVL